MFAISPAANPDGGSTVLRGRQLYELATPCLRHHGYETHLVSHLDVRDAVVILNKNVILNTAPDLIADLRMRNNRILADPLDGQVPRGFVDVADVLIASSMTQAAYFRTQFPGKPTAFVGHHVDIRIGDVRPAQDRLRIGYFGELYNARFGDELAERVDFHRVNTGKASDMAWMARLPGYNAHYAIRQRQSFDLFKPFTKGFIAAHCASPILVGHDDDEAMMHLGADYPYVLREDTIAAVHAVIDVMAFDFGGPRWMLARQRLQAVKAASSRDVVALQVLSAVIGGAE